MRICACLCVYICLHMCMYKYRVKGKNVNTATDIKNSEIASHLNLPPVKLHCSMLAEDAIKAAVKDVRKKQENAKKMAAQANDSE